MVWIDFDPQTGREQAGRRPALVLTPAASYNSKTDLAIVCPITTKVKGYPFEVALPDGLAVTGAILSDQVKSIDWRSRKATLLCKLTRSQFDEVRDRIAALLEI